MVILILRAFFVLGFFAVGAAQSLLTTEWIGDDKIITVAPNGAATMDAVAAQKSFKNPARLFKHEKFEIREAEIDLVHSQILKLGKSHSGRNKLSIFDIQSQKKKKCSFSFSDTSCSTLFYNPVLSLIGVCQSTAERKIYSLCSYDQRQKSIAIKHNLFEDFAEVGVSYNGRQIFLIPTLKSGFSVFDLVAGKERKVATSGLVMSIATAGNDEFLYLQQNIVNDSIFSACDAYGNILGDPFVVQGISHGDFVTLNSRNILISPHSGGLYKYTYGGICKKISDSPVQTELMCISPDSELFAAMSKKEIFVGACKDGKKILTLANPSYKKLCFGFNASGKRVYSHCLNDKGGTFISFDTISEMAFQEDE